MTCARWNNRNRDLTRRKSQTCRRYMPLRGLRAPKGVLRWVHLTLYPRRTAPTSEAVLRAALGYRAGNPKRSLQHRLPPL